MRALITGIAGFCGSHLAELLLGKGCEVAGVVRPRSELRNLEGVIRRARIYESDLRAPDSIKDVLAEFKPDRVYHLAATIMPQEPNASWEVFYDTNIRGTVNVLDSIQSLNLDPVVHIACSSAEYGLTVGIENPIVEQHSFRPVSHYAVSKIAQDMLGHLYWAAHGMRTVRTRVFNITGPRESTKGVCSSLARQIAVAEAGLAAPVIKVGNLTPRRDFVDVRDVVHGYWLATEKGEIGEVYNLSSGNARSIQDVLGILLGFSKVEVRVEQEQLRMRATDVPVQVGDYGKFRQQTGWRPEISLERSLRDLLDTWRQAVGAMKRRQS